MATRTASYCAPNGGHLPVCLVQTRAQVRGRGAFCQTSIDASFQVPDNLDLIFIDGSHTFESARSDYMHWRPKLRTGGILAIHDIYDTEEEGGQAPKEIYLKALTDGFKLRERVNSLVLLD